MGTALKVFGAARMSAYVALVLGVITCCLAPLAAAADVHGSASKTPQEPFVVHEWGTFTSFAGSDGVQLDFRPLLNEDLPAFVLDRESQAGARSMFTKGRLVAPVRMETPVTYFYVDEPREVSVKVQFPKGLLTEFYPPVRKMLPEYGPKTPSVRGPSELDWGKVTLIPQSALRPQLGNDAMSSLLAERLMAAAPPPVGAYGHYGAARATDSALVAVNLPAAPSKLQSPDPNGPTFPPPQGLHVEKFLFYRGVGGIDLPLEAKSLANGSVKVTNIGPQPIRSIFLIDVEGPSHQAKILRTSQPAINANETVTLAAPSEMISMAELQREVHQALVAEGLFEKEAAAMVSTWSDSWFQEPGLRLFYMVPQSLTDSVLPLSIEPKPEVCVRVLVGRMEILPPEREAAIAAAVRDYRTAHETTSDQGKSEPPPMPAVVNELGRFAEPALVRVRELARDSKDAATATELLHRLRAQ